MNLYYSEIEQINRLTHSDFYKKICDYSMLVYRDTFLSTIQIFARNSEGNYWDIYTNISSHGGYNKLKSCTPFAVDKYRKIIAVVK